MEKSPLFNIRLENNETASAYAITDEKVTAINQLLGSMSSNGTIVGTPNSPKWLQTRIVDVTINGQHIYLVCFPFGGRRSRPVDKQLLSDFATGGLDGALWLVDYIVYHGVPYSKKHYSWGTFIKAIKNNRNPLIEALLV